MANSMSFYLTNNSGKVLAAMEEQILRALERCGLQAESYAKDLAPGANNSVGSTTGNLRNSITHIVIEYEKAVYIGTNVHYAVYHELGTGSYAVDGNGRPGWWVYVPGSTETRGGEKKIYTKQEAYRIMMFLRSQGIDAHMTNGIKPRPFIKPALADHMQTYRNIFEDELKG